MIFLTNGVWEGYSTGEKSAYYTLEEDVFNAGMAALRHIVDQLVDRVTTSAAGCGRPRYPTERKPAVMPLHHPGKYVNHRYTAPASVRFCKVAINGCITGLGGVNGKPDTIKSIRGQPFFYVSIRWRRLMNKSISILRAQVRDVIKFNSMTMTLHVSGTFA